MKSSEVGRVTPCAPFFSTPARQADLRYHAAQLIGTPFAAHGMVPGAGMDCIAVPAWVYLKTGLLKEFHPPTYTLDGGKHSDTSKVIAWLTSSPHFVRIFPLNVECSMLNVECSPIQPGDALCFRQRRTEHHVGLALSEHEFIQCIERYGVIQSSLRDSIWSRALTAVYRPVRRSLGEGGPIEI